MSEAALRAGEAASEDEKARKNHDKL